MQLENGEVRSICQDLAEGKTLPAGWSTDYDSQNRQYFVDEVWPGALACARPAHKQFWTGTQQAGIRVVVV